MNLPKAIYSLIGVAVLVLGFIGWLWLHDRRVRELADYTTTITAKDDTIRVLNADIASLSMAIKAADDAYTAAKGTVIRVAYVPVAVRDSIAALTASLAAANAHGDTSVSIAVANGLSGQLLACRAQVDTIASAAGTVVSDCDKARATRDSTIAAQREVVRVLNDELTATAKLAGLSTPRFSPFVGANYSLLHKNVGVEGGVRLRLFSGFHLTAAARFRDSLDVVTGAEYIFR